MLRPPHFVHIKTVQGEQWHAYVAGKCHWFTCHTKGRTKPCLHEITSGELTCERCGPLQPTEVIGYQPLFRELDSRPCFVLVHESVREVVDSRKHFERVIVGRGDEKSDGVYVITALRQEPRFHTAVPWKMAEADLTATLLKVWGIPELIEWYARTQVKSDNAVSLPRGIAVKDDGTPYADFYQGAAKRAGATIVPEGQTTDAFDLAKERLKKRATANGKPDSNGKPPRS